MTFRKFRDTWLVAQPDGKALIAEYYDIAPRIVANINSLDNAAQIYKTIWKKYLAPCLEFIRKGDNLSCKDKYVEMIHELKRHYLYRKQKPAPFGGVGFFITFYVSDKATRLLRRSPRQTPR